MPFDPIDVGVGERVKMRRKALGISQTTLGKRLGVTFQQIQKYEKGSNRISSSRLQEIARALEMPVAAFFDHMPDSTFLPPAARLAFLTKDAVSLNQAFAKIPDPKIRRKIIALMETLAGDNAADDTDQIHATTAVQAAE